MVEPKGIEPLSKHCECLILPLNDSPIFKAFQNHIYLIVRLEKTNKMAMLLKIITTI